jgi:uncharacterized membrane protein (DUF485 family)
MADFQAPPPGALRRSPKIDTEHILSDPTFKELVRQRSSFAWTLSAIIIVIYLAFIFLVAFAKPLMATTIGTGVTSLGIVLGLIVIVSAFILTGIYVQRANAVFDAMSEDIKQRAR